MSKIDIANKVPYCGVTIWEKGAVFFMSLNVSLTPQLEALIREKVESGKYHSASEVVREGLRLLEERDLIRAAKLEALRKEIQAGLDSGPSAPLDFEDIKRRGRELLAQQQGKAE